MNERDVCPRDMRLGKNSVLSIVYNPSIHSREYIVANFLTSYIKVQHWNKEKKQFEDVESESFCYKNPDNNIECEVFTFVEVNAF